jgi:hypothetical protein
VVKGPALIAVTVELFAFPEAKAKAPARPISGGHCSLLAVLLTEVLAAVFLWRLVLAH